MSDEKSKEPIASVKLDHPLELKNGEKLLIVDFFRRPTAGDFRGIKNLTNMVMEDQCKIISNLTDIAPPVLYRLDFSDYERVAGIFTGFLGTGQETTEEA